MATPKYFWLWWQNKFSGEGNYNKQTYNIKNTTNRRTSRLLDWPGPEGRVSENNHSSVQEFSFVFLLSHLVQHVEPCIRGFRFRRLTLASGGDCLLSGQGAQVDSCSNSNLGGGAHCLIESAVPPIRLLLMIIMMPLLRYVAKENYLIALLRNEARNNLLMSGPWLSVAKLWPLSFSAPRWRCCYFIFSSCDV